MKKGPRNIEAPVRLNGLQPLKFIHASLLIPTLLHPFFVLLKLSPHDVQPYHR